MLAKPRQRSKVVVDAADPTEDVEMRIFDGVEDEDEEDEVDMEVSEDDC
jgi:hypothetical protein